MDLEIEVDPADRSLRVAGELDLSASVTFERALMGFAASSGDVRIEMAGLRFIDSTGLHVMLSAAEALKGRGRLILLNPARPVRRLLEITGTLEVFDIR